MGIPTLKCWHFEASEDIMTKFRSQGLHILRIKYWNASGVASLPPSLNMEHYKQAKLRKHLQTSVWAAHLPILVSVLGEAKNLWENWNF